MTEDQLEQETLGWLRSVGYATANGLDIAPDGATPERTSYAQVLLLERLRAALARLNPQMPAAARDDALDQVRALGEPSLLAANRALHRLLVNGVPVQYQKDGETRGDFARLVDWANPASNDWLAVNQFSVKGTRYTRRPDIVLFINGLPLVVLELKNPADANADIWTAYQQLQTYKEQIPDLFHYNELMVISDGSDARAGSLSADRERFLQWRTIDGVTLDPLGEFNELETLVHGLLAPAMLLDYLRYFVLFEDDGGLLKKVAGHPQLPAPRAAVGRGVPGPPGQRQEHHDDLLCSARDADPDDGKSDHRGDHRPQRPRRAVVWSVLAGGRFAARAAGAGDDTAGPARAARQPSVRWHHLRHHSKIHARRR